MVEGAKPRQTIDANPTSTEARTLLWSRIIIFTVSQNWRGKKRKEEKGKGQGYGGKLYPGSRRCPLSPLAASGCYPRSRAGSLGHRTGRKPGPAPGHAPSFSPSTACGSGGNEQLSERFKRVLIAVRPRRRLPGHSKPAEARLPAFHSGSAPAAEDGRRRGAAGGTGQRLPGPRGDGG